MKYSLFSPHRTSLFLALLCGMLWCAGLAAQETQQLPEKFSLVEIRLTDDVRTSELVNMLPLDCGCTCKQEGLARLEVVLNQYDLAWLKDSKIPYLVLIENMEENYASRATDVDRLQAEAYRQAIGTQMELGSMGGFYKLEEINQALDRLYQRYGSKNLITSKVSIGKSVEGKDLYFVKISDNASADEGAQEARVLYTALHHAREPAGMMTVFYFMHYLLENYETNSRVRNIVDNRELYFIPVVNPDGYSYNQRNSPNGGGMWRKNRNGSGIDLNRNYGPQELWNYANSGSSTSPSSDTYRGSTAFSEPETRCLRDFITGKGFRAILNYHTYSNLLIYPWGVRNELAHPTFRTLAVEMTRINGYRYGTAEGLLYPVRGVSDDWAYKVVSAFAMTPEVGGSSDGFWPRSSRIFPLAQENLEANLYLAEQAANLNK